MRVSVVLALAERQEVVELELEPGATIAQAVEASGLIARFPALDVAHMPAGIWSRPRPHGTPLRDGDRVELYRPLEVDAKAQRRARACQAFFDSISKRALIQSAPLRMMRFSLMRNSPSATRSPNERPESKWPAGITSESCLPEVSEPGR